MVLGPQVQALGAARQHLLLPLLQPLLHPYSAPAVWFQELELSTPVAPANAHVSVLSLHSPTLPFKALVVLVDYLVRPHIPHPTASKIDQT